MFWVDPQPVSWKQNEEEEVYLSFPIALCVAILAVFRLPPSLIEFLYLVIKEKERK